MGQGRPGINSALQPSHELKGLSFETEEYCYYYGGADPSQPGESLSLHEGESRASAGGI